MILIVYLKPYYRDICEYLWLDYLDTVFVDGNAESKTYQLRDTLSYTSIFYKNSLICTVAALAGTTENIKYRGYCPLFTTTLTRSYGQLCYWRAVQETYAM